MNVKLLLLFALLLSTFSFIHTPANSINPSISFRDYPPISKHIASRQPVEKKKKKKISKKKEKKNAKLKRQKTKTNNRRKRKIIGFSIMIAGGVLLITFILIVNIFFILPGVSGCAGLLTFFTALTILGSIIGMALSIIGLGLLISLLRKTEKDNSKIKKQEEKNIEELKTETSNLTKGDKKEYIQLQSKLSALKFEIKNLNRILEFRKKNRKDQTDIVAKLTVLNNKLSKVEKRMSELRSRSTIKK